MSSPDLRWIVTRLGGATLLALWLTAGFGFFAHARDGKAAPAPQKESDIDDGLTAEERALLDKPIQELTPEERRQRGAIVKKMKAHLMKTLQQGSGDTGEKGEPEPRRPATRIPTKPKTVKPEPRKPAPRRPAVTKEPPPVEDETDPLPPDEEQDDRAGDDEDPKAVMDEPPVEPGTPSTDDTTSPRSLPRSSDTGKSLVEPGLPDVPDENYFLPWNKRRYAFGVQDADYSEFIDMFSRSASLPVLGNPVPLSSQPDGRITYTTGSTLLDFDTTLHQVNDLLYSQINPPLYLYVRLDPDNPGQARLELDAIKEWRAKLPEDRVFVKPEDVDAAGLHGTDIVRVFFRPDNATDLEVFNELVSTILGDTVLASTSDAGFIDFYGRIDLLRKMRQYIRKFEDIVVSDTDIVRIPVDHLKPSDALEIIVGLVENVVGEASGTGTTRRVTRGKKGAGELSLESEQVIVIPDDKHTSLLVVGLPYKIEQIQRVLKTIDIPDDSEPPQPPRIVHLMHINADKAKEMLETVVSAATDGDSASTDDKRNNRVRRLPVNSADQLSITVDNRRNALILQGPDELVDFAEKFIASDIDIEVDDKQTFRRVEIQHRSPESVAEILSKILGGGRAKGEERFRVEVAEGAVIFTGEPEDLEQAEALIAQLDMPLPDPVMTYFVELERAEPSFVVEVLQALSSAEEGAAKPRAARRRGAGSSKFFADDRNRIVYFTGTQIEWEDDVLPTIRRIDSNAKPDSFGGAFVPLQFADGAETIETLNVLFPKPKRGEGGPVFAVAPGGLIVSGTDSGLLMDSIRETITLIDTDQYTEELFTRYFPLKYAATAQVQEAIRALFIDDIAARPGRRRPGKPGAAAAVVSEAISVTAAEGGIIVKASAAQMKEIEDLLALMDRPSPKDEVLVVRYELVHADVNEIAGIIQPLLQTKLSDLSDGTDPKAARGIAQKLTVQPDPRTGALLISAPQDLQDHAQQLISQLDIAVEGAEPEFNGMYTCINASAAELAALLGTMFAGDPVAAAIVPGGNPAQQKARARARNAARAAAANNNDSPFEFLPLPGDKAIAITAPTAEDLAAVQARAAEIDAQSVSGQRITRRFDVLHADVGDVAEWLVEMLDSKPAPRAAKKAGEDDFDWFSDFETKPNVGQDITTLANFDTRSVLVVATPDKMVAAEALIAQFDQQANPETIVEAPQPWELYQPEHISGMEFLEPAERAIESLYGYPTPVQLSLFDSDTIVMKGNRKFFADVKDIFHRYVDTPDRAAKNEERRMVGFLKVPSGVEQDRLLQMIKLNMQNYEFEIEDMSGDSTTDVDALIEEVGVDKAGRVECDDCRKPRPRGAAWDHICPDCHTARADVRR